MKGADSNDNISSHKNDMITSEPAAADKTLEEALEELCIEMENDNAQCDKDHVEYAGDKETQLDTKQTDHADNDKTTTSASASASTPAADTELDTSQQIEVQVEGECAATTEVAHDSTVSVSFQPGIEVNDEKASQPTNVKDQSTSESSDPQSQTHVTSGTSSPWDSLPATFKVAPDRSKKIVSSLAESNLFYEDCLQTLMEEEADDKLAKLLDTLQDDDTMSTAFSGIEAAGSAMNCLRYYWGRKLGTKLKLQRVLHQIEWNTHCGEELKETALLHDTCLFSNIQLFFRDEVSDTINNLLNRPHLAVEVIGPLLSSCKAMKKEAFCSTHNRICCLKQATRHVAGCSCKPYSKKGSQMSQGDPETIFTLAWIGLRLELQEPIVVSENVKTTGGATMSTFIKQDCSQPAPVYDAGLGNLIIRFLGPHYYLETTILDPALLGYPFSREREFIIMHHKQKCLPQISPLARFQKRFYRACAWSWKEMFLMHLPEMQGKGVIEQECENDLQWARNRPTCEAGALEEPIDLLDATVWEDSLTISEKRFLEEYRRAWPNTAYQLNQDPSSGHGHKAGEHAMFTLINNCGIVWSDTSSPPRWLTATETLMCQGFPVIPFIHNSADGLSVFSLKNSNRVGRHVCAQAGNSMHLAAMALIQLFTLVEIPLKPVCPLFKTIHEVRSKVRTSRKRSLENDETTTRISMVRLRGKIPQRDVAEANHQRFSFL